MLSGLVWRGLAIGAWASHIIVTTQQAAESGRQSFGLPTVQGTVTFESAQASDDPRGIFFTSANAVNVHGWDGWLSHAQPTTDAIAGAATDADDTTAVRQERVLTLPSFSGLLPDGPSALLRYPLRLGPVRRLRLRRPLAAHAIDGTVLPEGLRAVLGGPVASPCIQVDGVRVVAGLPVEIAQPPAAARALL